MVKAIGLILLLSGISNAGVLSGPWSGKLDLNPVVQPLVMRELHDGQWLAGVAKPNLWHLDQAGVQRFHLGAFQSWNAEHGNPAFGLMAGIDIADHIALAAGAIGGAIGVPSLFKPAALLGSVLSLDFLGGYRPFHDASVKGPWMYGVGAMLKVPFGIAELQKGL